VAGARQLHGHALSDCESPLCRAASLRSLPPRVAGRNRADQVREGGCRGRTRSSVRVWGLALLHSVRTGRLSTRGEPGYPSSLELCVDSHWTLFREYRSGVKSQHRFIKCHRRMPARMEMGTKRSVQDRRHGCSYSLGCATSSQFLHLQGMAALGILWTAFSDTIWRKSWLGFGRKLQGNDEADLVARRIHRREHLLAMQDGERLVPMRLRGLPGRLRTDNSLYPEGRHMHGNRSPTV